MKKTIIDYLKELKKIVAEKSFKNINDITDKLLIKEELGFDSLTFVRLLVEIEEKLEIVFDDADLDPGTLIIYSDIETLVANTVGEIK